MDHMNRRVKLLDVMKTPVWNNVNKRLEVIRDLIDIIIQQESLGRTHGIMDVRHIFYVGDKAYIDPLDPMSPEFKRLSDRIDSYRKCLCKIVRKLLPDDNLTGSLLDEYQHFKNMIQIADLSLDQFKQLYFHMVFMNSEQKLYFVINAHTRMGCISNMWNKFIISSRENSDVRWSVRNAVGDRLGFTNIYDDGDYSNETCASVLTYWRNCFYHLNKTLYKIYNSMTDEQREGIKFVLTNMEIGEILCAMFPELVVFIWNFFFDNNVPMHFHLHPDSQSGQSSGTHP